MSNTTTSTILLTKLQREIAEIEIVGTAPLIVHRWSEKAKLMMLQAQQGKKVLKDPKDPKKDFESSMYRFPDGGHGFPVTAFKSATVKGARAFKNVRMTELRQMLTFLTDGYCVDGMQLTKLSCTEPIMREDMVRVGMGTADLRYRAMYEEWSAVLRIEYLPTSIDLESIVALVDAGGMNGIGEWRPEKSGSFGTYEVMS